MMWILTANLNTCSHYAEYGSLRVYGTVGHCVSGVSILVQHIHICVMLSVMLSVVNKMYYTTVLPPAIGSTVSVWYAVE